MSAIVSIGQATPDYKYQQLEVADYLSSFFPFSSHEKDLFKLLFQKSGIKEKYAVIPDFDPRQQPLLFNPSQPLPGVETRLDFFNQFAPELAEKAVDDCLRYTKPGVRSNITHLITTTCTGLNAPGIEISLIKKLNLSANITRYPINFLGCHAAFKALDLADKICKTETGAKVLIVSVELSSLHFQNINTKDNWLATALFSDGAAAALVSNGKSENPPLTIKKFFSILNLSAEEKMAWEVTSKGFLMHLSSHIPDLIMDDAQYLIDKTLVQINADNIDYWSFHPGGIRILDKMMDKLGIPMEKISPSYQVLQNYGNMSSPTILFVLKNLLVESLKESSARKEIFAAGFGPGLSLEGMHLEYNPS